MIAKRINSKLLLAIAGFLVLVGVGGSLIGPGREPDQVLAARIGNVGWNHEQHARMEEIPNCQVCHHTEAEGTVNPRPCSDCHRVENDLDRLVQADLFLDRPAPTYEGEHGPPPMIAYHAKCIGCHEAMVEGPVLCRDCHHPGASGSAGRVEWNHFVHSRKLGIDDDGGARSDCTSCHHHDDAGATDGEYRPCSACHAPAQILGQANATGLTGFADAVERQQHTAAKHGECATCHTGTNPEFDGRTCADCHQPWQYDLAARELPNLEEAIHAQCQSCHNALDATGDRMPITCDGCHDPDPSWLASPDFGHVLWSHERHGKYRDLECTACHHQDLPDEPHVACRNCHETQLFDSPPLAEAYAYRCTVCHRDRKAGLTSWEMMVTEKPTVAWFEITGETDTFWWNHHAHALGDSFSCQECHHNLLRQDGEYVTATRIGRDWPQSAREIQACSNCHGPYGAVAGSIAEGTAARSLTDSYRKACLECHQRLGGGPQSWEEFFEEPEINWDAILTDAPAANEEDSK